MTLHLRSIVTAGLRAIIMAQLLALLGSPLLLAQPQPTDQVSPALFDGMESERPQMLAGAFINPPMIGTTYVGGAGSEQAMLRSPVAIAADGGVYVAGWTNSADFPPPLNVANQVSYVGEAAFIVKLSADLTSLLGFTVFDGSGNERISGIALGPQGEVYVVGNTTSSNLPTTVGALDRIYNGTAVGQDPYNEGDVFVAKLSSNLGSPQACTFLGGTGAEHSHVIAIGPDGSVVVAGSTESTNFPRSPDAYDTTVDPGGTFGLDAFVAVLDPNLQTLLAGTYIGGGSDDFTDAVAVSPQGDIYVGGWTSSTNYPRVAGKQMAYGGGNYDAFLSKFNPSLTTLSASTYLGGAYWDMILSMCLDSSGGVLVTGHTASRGSFPTAPGCYDSIYNGAQGEGTTDDCFVSRFSADLSSLPASTYLGGTLWDAGITIACNTSGRVFVVNTTNSTNFPLTPWSLDSTYNGGTYDLVLAVLSNDLSSLLFTTYLGGSGQELYPGMALNAAGDAYVAAPTQSANVATNPNAYDRVLSGPLDILLTGISAGTYTDSDGDGIVNLSDNCVSVANSAQTDSNHDGIGDACCCIGLTGNIDCDGLDGVDISDLSALIDNLYISLVPLCCPKEANVDGSLDGNVDISDLSGLIDFLYISFTPPGECL